MSTVSAYTLSDLRWTRTEATLAFIGGGLVALILLLTKARVLFHDSAPSWPWWFLQASRHRAAAYRDNLVKIRKNAYCCY